ncbi:MAG: TonB family protein [Candidatus Solibacter sp.]
MNESTARAERYQAKSDSSPLYVWEVPQKPVSVRIPFSLIDRLEKEAVESFRSLTSKGSEIGGLLIGDVTPGSPLVVSIADYDLIACDYTRGPLYRLSDADMGRFEQAVQQRLASGKGIAGFFRSHTRKGISLDADDLAVLQARFRDPHHIALLVRPFATKASAAGIFIWENGKVNSDASYLEFPFRSSELGAGALLEAPEKSPSPKQAPRAQIVPIAPRRETPLEAPAPVAAPVAGAPALTAPPPPPAAAAPFIEEKPAPAIADKPADKNIDKKNDKNSRPEKYDKNDRSAKNDKSGKAESTPTAKAVAPAVKLEPKTEIKPETKPERVEARTAFSTLEVPVEPKSGKGMKLILAAAASIALFVALFVYPGFLRNGSKPAAPIARQDTSQLQLRVERSNGELLLSWNRDADAIKNASKATLSINDGDQRENVSMDLSQLANGSIVYSPSGTDISFKMEVTDKNQKTTATETVRMLRTRPSPLNEGAAATAATSGAKPAGSAPNAPVPAPDTPAATPAAEPVAEQPKPVTALKAFKSESLSQRLRPAAPSDLPDAPTVSAATSSNASAIPGVGTAPIASMPAPAAPAPAATTPVANGAAPRTGGQIQQAVLVFRKDAEYPKIAKQTGAKGVVVLSATIGTDGNIKKVKVISGHPMLSNAAVEAVKQWRYRPTLLNGTPVEAETQVSVNFVGDR